MTRADRGYYERRLAQEQARAAGAGAPETRRAHAELARCYEVLLADGWELPKP